MSKRVLRDRSALRKPTDEPPAKIPPPKEVKKRPEPFNLEDLPSYLYEYVVEKMPFQELTAFYLASQLSVKMCGYLRKVEAPVSKVYIVKEVESYRIYNDEGMMKSRLNNVPKNVRLHTETLEIDKKDVTAIETYKISADEVEFYGDTGSDSEFIKQVMQMTRPQKIFLQSTSLEVLNLEDLKELENVKFLPWQYFDDNDLLSINLESFTIGDKPWHTPAISSEGIIQLLQEWKAGTRKIGNIRIMFDNLDMDLIHREFPGHPDKGWKMLAVCKQDGQSDCIVNTEYPHTVKISEAVCKGKKTRPFSRRVLAICVRWGDDRRSPPL